MQDSASSTMKMSRGLLSGTANVFLMMLVDMEGNPKMIRSTSNEKSTTRKLSGSQMPMALQDSRI